MHIGWDLAAYMGVRATKELEIAGHNLANVSTPGFKRELFDVWRLHNPGNPLGGPGPAAAFVDVRSRDIRQGSLQETGSETDLALEGPGFFKVETPRGLRYTRNGSFRLSADSKLVTQEGYPVLGKNGPVTLDARDKNFGIDPEGGIHLDGNVADQLLMVEFPNPQDLRAAGGTYYVPGPQAGEEMEAKNTRLVQGSLEASNVDLVAESLNLINVQRRYESYLKVLETFMANDRKVVAEIGPQA